MRSTIVDAMLSHLRGPGTSSIHTVCDGRFEIISCDVSPKSALVGRKLREVSMRGECLLLLVSHAEEGSYEVPHGEYEFLGGDKVVFIARSGDGKPPAMFGGAGKGA